MDDEQRARVRLHPIIVVDDRYQGTYSGAQCLAAPEGLNLAETDAHGSDPAAMAFFANAAVQALIGMGKTPNDAVRDLIAKTRDLSPGKLKAAIAAVRGLPHRG